MKPGSGLLGGAIAFYVVWTAATWFFEGRIATPTRISSTCCSAWPAASRSCATGSRLYRAAPWLAYAAGRHSRLMPDSRA